MLQESRSGTTSAEAEAEARAVHEDVCGERDQGLSAGMGMFERVMSGLC